MTHQWENTITLKLNRYETRTRNNREFNAVPTIR